MSLTFSLQERALFQGRLSLRLQDSSSRAIKRSSHSCGKILFHHRFIPQYLIECFLCFSSKIWQRLGDQVQVSLTTGWTLLIFLPGKIAGTWFLCGANLFQKFFLLHPEFLAHRQAGWDVLFPMYITASLAVAVFLIGGIYKLFTDLFGWSKCMRSVAKGIRFSCISPNRMSSLTASFELLCVSLRLLSWDIQCAPVVWIGDIFLPHDLRSPHQSWSKSDSFLQIFEIVERNTWEFLFCTVAHFWCSLNDYMSCSQGRPSQPRVNRKGMDLPDITPDSSEVSSSHGSLSTRGSSCEFHWDSISLFTHSLGFFRFWDLDQHIRK